MNVDDFPFNDLLHKEGKELALDEQLVINVLMYLVERRKGKEPNLEEMALVREVLTTYRGLGFIKIEVRVETMYWKSPFSYRVGIGDDGWSYKRLLRIGTELTDVPIMK